MTPKLRTDGLQWRQIDDQIVVLDAGADTYLSTNASGALLWRSIASGATREQLVRVLRDTYEIDESRASADADEFVASLADRGLLTS
jgi:hypothetical protein